LRLKDRSPDPSGKMAAGAIQFGMAMADPTKRTQVGTVAVFAAAVRGW
jgi:hypothetical protein